MGRVEVFRKCDELIRAGQILAAQRLFAQVPLNELRRSQILLAAQIARRIGKTELGLRLLYPYIHPEHSGADPREGERAEYATLLSLNGNIQEGLELLPAPALPESLLAKAWCYFEIWDYASAAPLLRNFLTRQTDPYYLASGRVNLGEALHGLGEREEGLVHLGEAISFAEENSYTRLWANALHVRAQCYAELGQKKKSNADLAKALKLFGDSPTADAFLIHRQIAFNQAAQSGNAKYLHQFRAKAARAQQWESLREVDYHILRLRFDRHLFSKLYWGTPYEAYRARLRRLGSPPPEYLWGPPGGRCLELSLGECRGESVLGKQPLAMLGQLLSDFYMPQSLGRIFSGVFPGERYHWKHSPNKVHQVLSRLRKVFQQKKIPLAVECRQGFYLLRPTGAFSVRLTEGQKGGGDPLERLARKFAGDFSAGAARAHLALPKTTVHRYLALAMDSGLVTKSGRGRATVYRFGEKKTQGA